MGENPMKKTVFLTGGTGNMGWAAFQEMLKHPDKINIKLLARKSEKNQKLLAPYEFYSNVEIVWGDFMEYLFTAVLSSPSAPHTACFAFPQETQNIRPFQTPCSRRKSI